MAMSHNAKKSNREENITYKKVAEMWRRDQEKSIQAYEKTSK